MVNLSNLLSSDHINSEPFILVECASQVFFSKDPKFSEWHIVLEVPQKVYLYMDETCRLSDNRVMAEIDVGHNIFGPSIENELVFNNDEYFEVGENKRKRKRSSKK